MNIVVKIIEIYQHTISPDHSKFVSPFFPDGYCRFVPSCSQYTKKSVEKFGNIKGLWLGIKRIIKCNPYASFGNDPVPEK